MRSPSYLHGVMLSALIVGCSGKTTEIPSDPVPLEYDVTFPSTAAAVATDALNVQIFDGKNDCLTLIENRKASLDLPASLAQTQQDVCAFAAGTAQKLTVGFGKVSILIVGTRAGDPLFIGCAQADVSAAGAKASVTLTLFDTTKSIPTTTCARLSEHCDKKC